MENKPDQEEKKRKPKRVHVIIAVGYVGENYNGSQMQNGVNALTSTTIEGELAKCLIQLGHCPSIEEIKFLDMERASRTDTKVSAVLSLFSFWCSNYQTLDADLNQLLPPDIRVFGVQRTTPRFNVRKMCTTRRYEYVLPIGMLVP